MQDALDLLHHPPTLYALTLVLGLMVGSFINLVVYRLPRILEQTWRKECARLLHHDHTPQMETPVLGLAWPGSQCPHCAHPIQPWENIPILSYLLLRGRCAACATPISWRYPLVELASGGLALLVIAHFGPTGVGAAALVFSWMLLALALIDQDTQLLPDIITLPGLWLGLLLSLTGLFTDPVSAILGAAIGYLVLWSVYHLFKILTGKEGMGYGDFKLLALIGAWLGWQVLPQIILLSAVVGAVLGSLMLIARGQNQQIPIPFGPYLAAAGWLSLLWGQSINHFYLHWAGLV